MPLPPPLGHSQSQGSQSQNGYRSPYGPSGYASPNYPPVGGGGGQSPIMHPQAYGFPPFQPYGYEYGQPQFPNQAMMNWNGRPMLPNERPQEYSIQQSPVHTSIPPNPLSHPPSQPPHPSSLPVQIANQGSVPVFGSISANGKIQSPPPPENKPISSESSRERQFVFGSIGVSAEERITSPPPPTIADSGEPKTFTAFSIGISADEQASSSIRSRTRSGKARSRNNGVVDRTTSQDSARSGLEPGIPVAEVKVIDLTDAEPKWEFAGSNQLEATQELPTEKEEAAEASQEEPPRHTEATYPPRSQQTVLPTENRPSTQLSGAQAVPLPVPSTYGGLPPPPLGEEFLEVQDYGYGFGPSSGTGIVPLMMRERERERERERWETYGPGPGGNRGGGDFSGRGRDWRGREPPVEYRTDREPPREPRAERDYLPRDNIPTRDYVPREYGPPPTRGGRRGTNGPLAPPPFVNERGADRGIYGVGRRGRSFVRGYGGRGGYGRGGYGNQQTPPMQSRQPAYTPPSHFNALPSQALPDPSSGFYPPPQATFYPPQQGYDMYQPPVISPQSSSLHPVPAPLSSINFPIDPTRWQLLGQLEYYLSAQNMVSDFFLRQQVSKPRHTLFAMFLI